MFDGEDALGQINTMWLVHAAHRIYLNGESLRKNQSYDLKIVVKIEKKFILLHSTDSIQKTQ